MSVALGATCRRGISVRFSGGSMSTQIAPRAAVQQKLPQHLTAPPEVLEEMRRPPVWAVVVPPASRLSDRDGQMQRVVGTDRFYLHLRSHLNHLVLEAVDAAPLEGEELLLAHHHVRADP